MSVRALLLSAAFLSGLTLLLWVATVMVRSEAGGLVIAVAVLIVLWLLIAYIMHGSELEAQEARLSEAYAKLLEKNLKEDE